MANPQLEDGRIEIANEIGDVLAKTHFSPAESKILWAVLRKTYGWHKKSDKLSFSQFEGLTGLDRRHISRALQRLITRNILFSSKAGIRHISEYGLQKNYELWELTPKSAIESDTKIGNKLLPKSAIEHKTNLTPILTQSDTNFDKPIDEIGNKSIAKIINNNSKKHITKAITKAIEEEIVLPEWIENETWENYLEMRTKIKKPATEVAKPLLIKKLAKLKSEGEDPNEVLERSIMNSWQGLFALKNQSFGGTENGKPVYTQRPNAVDSRRNTQHTPEEYERSARENNVPD